MEQKLKQEMSKKLLAPTAEEKSLGLDPNKFMGKREGTEGQSFNPANYIGKSKPSGEVVFVADEPPRQESEAAITPEEQLAIKNQMMRRLMGIDGADNEGMSRVVDDILMGFEEKEKNGNR